MIPTTFALRNPVWGIFVFVSILGANSFWVGKDLFQIAILCGYCIILYLIAILDHSKNTIPNKLTLIPLPIVFVLSYLSPNLYEHSNAEYWWISPLAGGIISGAIFGLCYYIPKAELGGGDVKLAALIGCICGFPVCLASLLLGMIIFATKQSISRRTMKVPTISPLAPYLFAGTWISLIAAQQI